MKEKLQYSFRSVRLYREFSSRTLHKTAQQLSDPHLPMHTVGRQLRISSAAMNREFSRVLRTQGFSEERAQCLSDVFTENSLDGVMTHGVNRFARFIRHVREGFVRPDAEPRCVHAAGAMEQWDGQQGPGPLNAFACTERAEHLADENGVGCVALANTNHWLRGGTYARRAAGDGYAFIGWTNTIGNMPAWGATDRKIGNNPLVIGMPHEKDAVVLDMSMSQYSYGAMESVARNGAILSYPGGYDNNGRLTSDPVQILTSHRPLPIGYWKGSGAALLLDLFAAVLSGGAATADISAQGHEYGVSQVFMCFRLSALSNASGVSAVVRHVMEDFASSIPVDAAHPVRYPGEHAAHVRKEYASAGIPVDADVWKEILEL